MSTSAQVAKHTKLFIKKGEDWLQIKELRSIKPGGAEVEKIDCTDLDSDAEESLPGMVNHSTLTIDLMVLESDPGQAEMLVAFEGDNARQFKHETKLKRRLFSGTVTKWPTIPDASLKGLLEGTGEIQINGKIAVEDI